MLHILWLIVKFILLVLGGLFGVLLLLLLLILFCPVRYRAEVRKDQPDWKRTEGEAGVSWLFHGITVRVQRVKETTSFTVRVLGIPLDRFLKRKDRDPEKEKKPGKDKKRKKNETRKKTDDREAASKEALPKKTELPEAADTDKRRSASNADKEPPGTPETAFKQEETAADTKETSASAPDISAEKSEHSEKNTLQRGFFDRFRDKLTEIRSKIVNIGLTFRNIHDKIEWWKKFIHHPRTQEAISLVWKHGKFLIHHILPTKVEGQVVFGCENPAVTGEILGLLGMTIPFHKNCVAVTPLFDGGNVLEGKVKLRGRIYGIVLVRAAIIIYFNKNVKYVIRRVRHGKHKEG